MSENISKEKKITVEEIKEILSTSTPDIKKIINIGGYIPYFTMVQLINQIAMKCVEVDKTGIARADYCLADYMLDITAIQYYTNIEDVEVKDGDTVDNSIVGNYDFFKEKGIIEEVEFTIGTEYFYMTEKVYDLIKQEVELHNSIENVIRDGLNKLVEKLPDEKGLQKFITNIPKAINKIDSEKLELVKSVVGLNRGDNLKE